MLKTSQEALAPLPFAGCCLLGFPAQVNSPPASGGGARDAGPTRVRKVPWRRKRPPTPVFLSGKSHGQRSLVGYRPWGRKDSDTTEQLSACVYMHTHTLPPAWGQAWVTPIADER